jgi:hypothetical protein
VWIEYQTTDGKVRLEVRSEHKERRDSKMERLIQTAENTMIS